MFGPSEKLDLKRDKGQETVNEEATTDTQLDSEFEREAQQKDASQVELPNELKNKHAVKAGQKFESGIKSSGEEDEHFDLKQETETAKPKSSSSESSDTSLSSSDDELFKVPSVKSLRQPDDNAAEALKERDAQEN